MVFFRNEVAIASSPRRHSVPLARVTTRTRSRARRPGPIRRGGRSPNSARPIRTMVDPFGHRRSRSSVMPIDRSAQAQLVGQLAHRPEGARAAPALRAGPRPSARGPATPASARPATSPAPPPAGSRCGRPPLETSTSTSTVGARPTPADRPPSASRATRLPAVDQRGQRRHLVALDGARGSANGSAVPDDRTVGRPWPPAPGRSSPRRREAGRQAAATTASAPKPFVTATTWTVAGSPPADSIRWRTAASRSATPSESIATSLGGTMGPR